MRRKYPSRRICSRRSRHPGTASLPRCRNAAWRKEEQPVMAETFECMKVEVADFVATVTLARPPVNAQNRRFREEIITIFDMLSDRADVRAVVLTGEGKTFSAGADLKERPGLSDGIGAYPRHNRLVRESF